MPGSIGTLGAIGASLRVHYAIGGHFRYRLCHPPIIAPSDDQRQAPFTERLRRFREVRRRTRPMGVFSDRTSMDRILCAVFNHETRNQGVSTPLPLTHLLTLPAQSAYREPRQVLLTEYMPCGLGLDRAFKCTDVEMRFGRQADAFAGQC